MRPWPSLSLRARLLWLLFAAITVTVAVQAPLAYRTAMQEADEIFDYHMRQTAMSLRTGLPQIAWERRTGVPASDEDDDFIVQVWTAEGQLVFRSIEQPELPKRGAPGFSEIQYQGTHYRSFTVASSTHVIEVAQDLAVRRQLARELALHTTLPMVVCLNHLKSSGRCHGIFNVQLRLQWNVERRLKRHHHIH